jgi:hypothetical protein
VASQEWDCGFTGDCFYSCRDRVLYVVTMDDASSRPNSSPTGGGCDGAML